MTKPLSAWDGDVIIANLSGPRRHWLWDYEDAVSRGDFWRADFALDRLLEFDRRIAIIRSLCREESEDPLDI